MGARRRRRDLLCLAIALALGPAGAKDGGDAGPATAADLRALVAEGQRLWTTSPDPRNPVACATCHRDPARTRGWAASFPKFKPLPPPHARVMTLLQVNAEAVERHYRLRDPLPAATAITAFLTAVGADVPISPGISAGQPVFPSRMRALARSVSRGARLFARRCSRCHDGPAVAPALTAFPRIADGQAEPLERFLERHLAPPIRWDGGPMADLIAYLASMLTGRHAGPSPNLTSNEAKEGS
jgi:mono/diheme cytochrome c family protein